MSGGAQTLKTLAVCRTENWGNLWPSPCVHVHISVVDIFIVFIKTRAAKPACQHVVRPTTASLTGKVIVSTDCGM